MAGMEERMQNQTATGGLFLEKLAEEAFQQKWGNVLKS